MPLYSGMCATEALLAGETQIRNIGAAMAFALPAALMLIIWFKDMLPQLHDIFYLTHL